MPTNDGIWSDKEQVPEAADPRQQQGHRRVVRTFMKLKALIRSSSRRGAGSTFNLGSLRLIVQIQRLHPDAIAYSPCKFPVLEFLIPVILIFFPVNLHRETSKKCLRHSGLWPTSRPLEL